MDVLAILEDLASASIAQEENQFSKEDIDRWSRLFALTYDEALEAMESHFSNLSRIQISDSQWGILKDSVGVSEHDKESYSYLLGLSKAPKKPKSTAQTQSCSATKTEYVFKLTPPFDTALVIQQAARLPHLPRLLNNEETNEQTYVVVDGDTRSMLESLVPNTRLTFAALKRPAEKSLSSHCIAPALGIDATLPQHRGVVSILGQDEYPVPYFFYGTLADPEVLTRLLSLDDEPILRRAEAQRGRLGMWGGNYRALVDGQDKDRVDGWMYLVESRDAEDCLRHYEGQNYEVVRCTMSVSGDLVKGLTFRFCGDSRVL
ncbi:unnamed protein product [Periconia digitata]|uniref:Putative gamma-glutamylcyclotransferase n=1 Tax=Periconia digitata TaxID=1303443 RepID=A0A9W4XVY5_9PLEO|nr:unnamed protein product [Periconia digitata]